MSKTSYSTVVENALKVLRLLFDYSDDACGIQWRAFEELLSEHGLPTDRRFVSAVIDGARASGIAVDRPRSPKPGEPGYRFAERLFEEWEVGFLSDATQCSRALSRSEKAQLRKKLSRLLPKQSAPHIMRDIVSEPQKSVYSSVISSNLCALNTAIATDRQVMFDYWEYAADGTRHVRPSSTHVPVDPYVFVYKNDAYYLIAGKTVDETVEQRTYRIDRMTDVCVLESLRETTVADLKLPLSEQLAASFGMHLTPEVTIVTLAFESSLAKFVVERYGNERISPAPDGKCIASVPVALSSAFYAWVAQFGGAMKIQGPEEAIDGYRNLLKAALG